MIPMIISAAEAMRQKVAESWKKMMPIRKVPAAPMPVHTAYAVPMGISRCAR